MTRQDRSYTQILKATSLVGGATVVGLFVGVIRTKILAVLLGPSGIALFGIYGSVTDLLTMLSGMGIPHSGVRQVAEAIGQANRDKISRTIITLRRATLMLGIVGLASLIFLCAPISRLTFGDSSHAGALALLSLSILFTAVSAGQTALIQGMRRLRDLAAIKLGGSLCGLLVSVPLVWLFGERGVALAMVASSAVLLLISWRFARRVPIDRVDLSLKETYTEAKSLLGLGFAFMVSGVLIALTAYVIRAFITNQLGIEAVGHYQAAFSLSSIYIGIILSAMGADFYPRLTAVCDDNETCNRFVNEQSEVALLLAGPGIVATLALAPLIVNLFYSEDFLPAVDVLRWQILGLLGRIVSWPLGFIILAKGKGRVFIGTETIASVVHLLLIFYATRAWGLIGTGIAFFVLNVLICVMLRLIVRKVSGFRWTSFYVCLLATYTSVLFIAFLATLLLSPITATIISSALTVALVIFSIYRLHNMLGPSLLGRLVGAYRFRASNKS